MTKIQAIVFAIGAISVVGGIWCLTLSIENMKLEKANKQSKGGEK